MFINQLLHGGIRAILDYDNTVFDNMQLPEGVELSDVADHIIMKYGDTPLYAPDPAVIKYYIGSWSRRRLPLWERYKKAIELEYDPIENYDRREEGSDTNENLISADNSSDYQPDSKSIRIPALRTHGNIGVTTSQQMLVSELDLVPRLDLIDYIADDFRSEFCLSIYTEV